MIKLTDPESIAIQGEFLDAYLNLKADGLRSEQAIFAAWYTTPPSKRQPKTMKELAEKLGRSYIALYKWQHSDWFKDKGIAGLRERLLLPHLASVHTKTIHAALTEDGAAGVAARKLYYDLINPPESRIVHTGSGGGEIIFKMIYDDQGDGAKNTLA